MLRSNFLKQTARSAALRNLTTAARPVRSFVAPSSRVVFRQPAIQSVFGFQQRFYSGDAGLDRDEVQARIIEVVKSFDKISKDTEITPTATFASDLGLDSLDTVEVVMAIEEEFSIEIPDKEADEIKSIGQAIDYILAQADAV
ncbi:acyl carrier protein-like protein [Lipomyces arxii]|uniref:acyl carrier protein-like protein n=1 Tax=Lipomyces arxii TaxID=56418 RepID=UPI0034CE3321